jgi:hypothetical protein
MSYDLYAVKGMKRQLRKRQNPGGEELLYWVSFKTSVFCSATNTFLNKGFNIKPLREYIY